MSVLYGLSGLAAAALIIYLFVAMFKPEWFE
jgi:K+-transporting ATPase KdpF subunit